MRKEKMNYGNLVYLDPVIYTDAYVFIPKLFGWEKESVSAEIIVETIVFGATGVQSSCLIEAKE